MMPTTNATKHFQVYDVTLRDGLQNPRLSMTLEERRRAAKLLDEFGVDYIEAGWPGAVPLATEFFKDPPILHHAKLVAFGSTTLSYTNPQNDPLFMASCQSPAQVVTLFGKTWDMQVHDVLNVSLEENLNIIEHSVRYIKNLGKEMHFDAEHFFDGYTENPAYTMKCLDAAFRGGADVLVLCDTNGGMFTDQIVEVGRVVRHAYPHIRLGIHTHNDAGQAVANSMAAIRQCSFDIVQGTINGYGERTGNANLCEIIPVMILRGKHKTSINPVALESITDLSRTFDELVGVETPANRPITGIDAPTHTGGGHIYALRKNARTYNLFDWQKVGQKMRFALTDQAGTATIMAHMEEIGLTYPDDKKQLKPVLDALKDMETKGYRFERAPESSAVFFATKLNPDFKPFCFSPGEQSIKGEHVSEKGKRNFYTATVTVDCQGRKLRQKGTGVGPVNAMDIAARKALTPFFPELEDLVLKNYKVDLVDKEGTTGARTRVYIESFNNTTGQIIKTMGVSKDLFYASQLALEDSYKFMILANNGTFKNALARPQPRINTRPIASPA